MLCFQGLRKSITNLHPHATSSADAIALILRKGKRRFCVHKKEHREPPRVPLISSLTCRINRPVSRPIQALQ